MVVELVLNMVVALMLLRTCLQLLTSVQLVWWLTRTDRYDEFRVWTLEVCAALLRARHHLANISHTRPASSAALRGHTRPAPHAARPELGGGGREVHERHARRELFPFTHFSSPALSGARGRLLATRTPSSATWQGVVVVASSV